MIKKLKKFWEFGAGRLALAAFCAHSVSISIGTTQGYSAILIPQLEGDEEIIVTPTETSLLASFGTITNPIGSVLSGLLAEYFGRKRSIQVSSIPFIVGWILIGFATDINWLYAGRLVSGIAAGMSPACYTYVSEISTPENRGFLQSLGPICASFGIFLTYTLGYFISWKLVALISISFAVFSMIAMQFLPESPGYLLKKNKTAECFNVFLWLRRNIVVAQEEINRYNTNQKKNNTHMKKLTFRESYLGPQTVKPFIILVTLFFLQEFAGIYTLLFYAVSFFQETDLNVNEYVSSIIVGAIRFTMSIAAAFLINKYGRKILCTLSSLGMMLAMLAVAIYIKFYELYPEKERVFSYFPLIGIILNVVFSMIGMLPIPWVMVGEMFPLEVRPIMSGVVICLAQTFIFICVQIYNTMVDNIKFSGTLFTFIAASFLSILFCWFILPETKNKTLEEIEENFRTTKTKKQKDLEGFDNNAFDHTSEEVKKSNGNICTVRIGS